MATPTPDEVRVDVFRFIEDEYTAPVRIQGKRIVVGSEADGDGVVILITGAKIKDHKEK